MVGKKRQIEQYHFLKNEPKKRQFDLYDLATYQSKNSSHLFKPHTHSFYQVIWFKNANGKHFIDFESYDIKENRLFFIAKNQVHYFEERKDYEGVLIHFNESFILSNDKDINFFLNYLIFNNNTEPFYQVPNHLEAKVISYFNLIENELISDTAFGNEQILSNLLKSLLLIIEREKRLLIGSKNELAPQKTAYLEFRDLLEINFARSWSVSDFAKELAISTKTLNLMVKQNGGTTVSRAIANRIILEAKRKLTHTNLFVSEIAFDLGFTDPYYFIKFFKKHVSYTPSEFRKIVS